MNTNIICTQDDKEFDKYKDIVKERKVKFTIKQIFKDWWNSFLNDHPNFKIRDVVFKNCKYQKLKLKHTFGLTAFSIH